ncbi:MAG: YicC/YloC family endoribonuclease [Desulfonauticus sp.]|nr:YicC/YloC family endoribonuclease [Desulfonauticus sp.]
MKSMTGYGQYIFTSEQYAITWEIKSVNSRFLDIIFKTPHYLLQEQNHWEKIIKSKAKRGRIEVYLHISFTDPELCRTNLDKPQAIAMLKEIQALATSQSINFIPDLNRFFTLSHLWKHNDQSLPEQLILDLGQSLSQTLTVWDQSRITEGNNLKIDIEQNLASLKTLLQKIKLHLKDNVQIKFQALMQRINELVKHMDIKLNEDKIITELAFMTDKLDVSEELSRLNSHLQAIEELLNNTGEIGRKLDFYLQECFREITTCSNKSQHVEINRLAVEIKSVLEKIREQAQNLE